MELPRGIAPLGYRNFALYWIGVLTSNTGRWLELTGVVWLGSELTDSPALLGLIGIFRGVPAILFGPISGVFADRLDQRRVLFVTQLVAMTASLLLGIGAALGVVQLWELYLQVAIQATVESFDASTRQAMFPRFVPRSARPEAVTLVALAGRVSKFIGPTIAGVAIATIGVAAPFFLNAGTFLALLAAVFLIRGIAPRTAEAGSSIGGELLAGLRYVMAEPVVGGLLRMEAVFSLAQMNPVMIVIIGRQVLGLGPEGLGGLISATGLGAIAGLVYLLVAGHLRRQGRFIVACTFAYVAGLLLFAYSHDYVLSFIALAITGLFDVLLTVTRNSVIQLTTPGRMRGRVIGTVRMVTGGFGQLSQVQSGLLTGAIGAPLAIVVAAGALALSAGSSAWAIPALWAFSREDQAPRAIPSDTPTPGVT